MEFELIHTYFKQRFEALSRQSAGVVNGIGDDCAVLVPNPDHRLVVTSDLLTVGRHFFQDAEPFALGYKALAVNLSDLASMGAQPLGFTLSLALGRVRPEWLDAFSKGLFELAQSTGCPLVGGDTTRAQRADDCVLSITAFGEVPVQTPPLLRQGALDKDDVWVSGQLGLARLGLLAKAQHRGVLNDFLNVSAQEAFHARWSSLSPEQQSQCANALDQPEPRLVLGQSLLGLANASIDLSDGLAGDLNHLCKASSVGIELFEDALVQPFVQWLEQDDQARNLQDFDLENLLTGGDDYELCFTAPASRRREVERVAGELSLPLYRVGVVTQDKQIRLKSGQGRRIVSTQSFNHF